MIKDIYRNMGAKATNKNNPLMRCGEIRHDDGHIRMSFLSRGRDRRDEANKIYEKLCEIFKEYGYDFADGGGKVKRGTRLSQVEKRNP